MRFHMSFALLLYGKWDSASNRVAPPSLVEQVAQKVLKSIPRHDLPAHLTPHRKAAPSPCPLRPRRASGWGEPLPSSCIVDRPLGSWKAPPLDDEDGANPAADLDDIVVGATA
mmetsp:Transcript_49676/g.140706  ORF Transcript_49676/g.140706 Transcript_49676/m.140706 type:complete len:113 (-) Transcript_49676:951-1289(-)